MRIHSAFLIASTASRGRQRRSNADPTPTRTPPSVGIVAYWLKAAGVSWDPILNGGHAMALVVIAAVWKQISYNFLFFYAGLQAIPRSLIEAAAIDGAGPVRRFFGIALPLLSPTSFFLLTVNVVYAFFDTEA